MEDVVFRPWGKTPRFFDSPVVLSEKIDGTNGCIYVNDTADDLKVGSRNRWLSLGDDNFGFCKWVMDNKQEMIALLGPGFHYGEWWGQGIQRKYNMERKVFSLFNTHRWGDLNENTLCDCVPFYTTGIGSAIDQILDDLTEMGRVIFLNKSKAAGKYGVEFDNPEGYMIYHARSNQIFKVPTNK